MDLAIKNGKLVNHDGIFATGIGVDKGKIVILANEADLPSASETIDASGKYILPGVCDMHCHEDFPGKVEDGFAPWTRISGTESAAAAIGGVTTQGFYLMPPANQTLAEAFDGYLKPWLSNSVTDTIFHIMTVNHLRLDEMEKDCSEYGITTFKFLVGYKGAQAAAQGHPGLDDGFLVEGFHKVVALRKKGWPALALVHAENPDIIPYLTKEASKRYDVRAWHDSRPNFVEEESMRKVLFLASVTGCPVLIVHTTIRETGRVVARAQSDGMKIERDFIIETCPQYLTQNHDNATDLMRKKPVFTVVNPPVRGKEDNEALWEGIKQGIVTVIGSDTSPSTMKSKDVDMWKAPFVPMGISSNTGFILPVMLSEGVNKRGLSLEKVVEVTSYNPARYYGIYPQKGIICVGSDADFAIVDMNKEVTWNHAASSPSNADWNIYDGWKFTRWPVMTVFRGQVTARDMKVVAKSGYGKYIARKKL